MSMCSNKEEGEITDDESVDKELGDDINNHNLVRDSIGLSTGKYFAPYYGSSLKSLSGCEKLHSTNNTCRVKSNPLEYNEILKQNIGLPKRTSSNLHLKCNLNLVMPLTSIAVNVGDTTTLQRRKRISRGMHRKINKSSHQKFLNNISSRKTSASLNKESCEINSQMDYSKLLKEYAEVQQEIRYIQTKLHISSQDDCNFRTCKPGAGDDHLSSTFVPKDARSFISLSDISSDDLDDNYTPKTCDKSKDSSNINTNSMAKSNFQLYNHVVATMLPSVDNNECRSKTQDQTMTNNEFSVLNTTTRNAFEANYTSCQHNDPNMDSLSQEHLQDYLNICNLSFIKNDDISFSTLEYSEPLTDIKEKPADVVDINEYSEQSVIPSDIKTCDDIFIKDDEEAEDDLDELELRRLALCAFMSHNSKPTEDDWLVEANRKTLSRSKDHQQCTYASSSNPSISISSTKIQHTKCPENSVMSSNVMSSCVSEIENCCTKAKFFGLDFESEKIVNDILSIDDKNERIRKVQNLLAIINDHTVYITAKRTDKEKTFVASDNYEEVEMELENSTNTENDLAGKSDLVRAMVYKNEIRMQPLTYQCPEHRMVPSQEHHMPMINNYLNCDINTRLSLPLHGAVNTPPQTLPFTCLLQPVPPPPPPPPLLLTNQAALDCSLPSMFTSTIFFPPQLFTQAGAYPMCVGDKIGNDYERQNGVAQYFHEAMAQTPKPFDTATLMPVSMTMTVSESTIGERYSTAVMPCNVVQRDPHHLTTIDFINCLMPASKHLSTHNITSPFGKTLMTSAVSQCTTFFEQHAYFLPCSISGGDVHDIDISDRNRHFTSNLGYDQHAHFDFHCMENNLMTTKPCNSSTNFSALTKHSIDDVDSRLSVADKFGKVAIPTFTMEVSGSVESFSTQANPNIITAMASTQLSSMYVDLQKSVMYCDLNNSLVSLTVTASTVASSNDSSATHTLHCNKLDYHSNSLFPVPSKQQIVLPEDEEDMRELREQLIRSMNARRKLPTNDKLSVSSVSCFGNSDPSSTAQSLQSIFAVNSRMSNIKSGLNSFRDFPIHKPVIIQLDHHSSEDDDAIKNDSLKSSYAYVDRKPASQVQQMVSSHNVKSHIYKGLCRHPYSKHTEFSLMKDSIVSNGEKLKTLISQQSKFISYKKKSDLRVAHLKKELHTVELVAEKFHNLVINNKQQIKKLRNCLLKKKSLGLRLETKLLSMKQKLHNNSLPNVYSSTASISHEFIGNEKIVHAPLSVVTGTVASHTITQLRMRAEAIKGELIKLRRAAAQRSCRSSGIRNLNVKPHSVEDQLLPESFHCSTGGMDQKQDTCCSSLKLAAHNLSQKPRLLLKNCSDVKHAGSELTNLKLDSKELINFKMPSGVQFANLCRIQNEKVDTVLDVTEQATHEMFVNIVPKCGQVPGLKLRCNKVRHSMKSVLPNKTLMDYSSPLLHLRSYRFSAYFRTKAGLMLSSTSSTNKLRSDRALCHYELQGTCNDEHCQGQHSWDYQLSERETLIDLVSYQPSLAGISDCTSIDKYPVLIGDYVDKLMSSHMPAMSTDDLCVLLTDKVNDIAGHVLPHTTFLEGRTWHLENGASNIVSMSTMLNLSVPVQNVLNGEVFCAPMDSDPFMEVGCMRDTEDWRYFVADGDPTGMADPDSVLLTSQHDTVSWLRLAFSKLSSSDRSNEECLDQALNVLSRGLELNRHCSDLWVKYLILYGRHRSAFVDSDFNCLCETALTYAAHYDIWLMLLQTSNGFHAKDGVCNRILTYLLNVRTPLGQNIGTGLHSASKQEAHNPASSDTLDYDNANNSFLQIMPDADFSHKMLEVVLFKVQLNILSGRFKPAVKFLQVVLGLKESKELYRKCFTHSDKVVLWICLTNVTELHCLPQALFGPSHQNPGHIRSKDNLYIDWDRRLDPLLHYQQSVQYLGEAVSIIDINDEALQHHFTTPQYILAVYNLVTLFKSMKRSAQAISVLANLLKHIPQADDVRLMLSDIYVECDGNHINARQVLLNAQLNDECNSKLCYYAALLAISQGETEAALNGIEMLVANHFTLCQNDCLSPDIDVLFLMLLGLELPIGKILPIVIMKIKRSKAVNTYLWLCYTLWLDLHGKCKEACSVFEFALSASADPTHLCRLWKCYVHFLHRQHQETHSSSWLQRMRECIMHSVTTMSSTTTMTRANPPGFWQRGCTYQDYSTVNELISFYLHLFPSDLHFTTLHSFLELKPDNLALRLRCVETALKERQLGRALCLCKHAACDNLANCHFWKTFIALTHKEDSPSEVEKLYVRAVTAMPLCVSLWKDVSQGKPDTVRILIDRCDKMGLNIHGYIATIFSTS